MTLQNLLSIRLSPADRHLIENDHARLERFLSDLRDTCSHFMSAEGCNKCGFEKVATCKGRLPSYFYDFYDLVSEHCENEEFIMSKLPHSELLEEFLRLHKEDHARLMRELKILIQESTMLVNQGNVAVSIRQFYQLINDSFSAHAHCFDNILLNTYPQSPG